MINPLKDESCKVGESRVVIFSLSPVPASSQPASLDRVQPRYVVSVQLQLTPCWLQGWAGGEDD